MRLVRVLSGAAFAATLAIGVCGCENTTEAVPKLDSAPATGVNGGPPPKDQSEYRKNAPNPYAGGAGYPGAK